MGFPAKKPKYSRQMVEKASKEQEKRQKTQSVCMYTCTVELVAKVFNERRTDLPI